jgi:glutathione peroxidase
MDNSRRATRRSLLSEQPIGRISIEALQYRLTYVPGHGTELRLNGESLGVVPGSPFGRHYFKVWLGDAAVSREARDQLLRDPRAASRRIRDVTSIYDFEIRTADGRTETLEPYRGKVMLIVNVASKCGFTSQYDGLEKLYQTYRDRGLVILGFPCNQFGSQEPGTDEQIQSFCRTEYGVTFPVFAKLEVNGDGAHPLYRYLKKEAPGLLGSEKIKWNFTKFLIDRDGTVVERFASATKPEDLVADVEDLLGE